MHVEELVAAFRAGGNDVVVVGPGFFESGEFGVESPVIAVVRRLLPPMAKELAEITFNVINYWRLYRAYRAFAPDLIYERYNLYLFAGAWLARWTGLPLYLEVNSPLASERARFGELQLKSLARAAENYVWRAASRLFVVTGALKDIVAASCVERDRIQVVPNGVVLERFRPSMPHAVRSSITLGFVGFLRSWHGMDSVIEAMSTYTGKIPLRLIVVGDGPARPALEAQVASLGLTCVVEFIGVVPFEDVPDLLRSFDIALQPKAVLYASPLKIFDYMAAGLAIVAPDQPNIREILRDNVTAMLFAPDSPKSMWQSITRLIEEPALIDKIGLAARSELVSRDYTWRGNAERIVSLAKSDVRLNAELVA